MNRPLAHRRPRVLGFWVVLAAVVVLAVAVAALTVRTRSDAAAAERAASSAPATLPTVAPTRTISIVADEATLQPTQKGFSTDWPQVVGRALDAQVFVIDSGDGYVHTNAKGDPTFVNHAGEVAPRADVVVFVGGRDDVDASQSALLKAAASTYASAAETAPQAQLVVVGPVVAPPASTPVLAVRNRLLYSVVQTHAEFIDPIAGGWLTASSFDSTGALTKSGRAAFAKHMTSVIGKALDGH